MIDNFGHLSESELEDIKRVFYSQSYEILETLQELLLGLEADPGNDSALKTIKRYIHTLKGDSNSFGLVSIGALCHSMEDVLSSFIDNGGRIGHEIVDILLDCVDVINTVLAESESGSNGTDVTKIIERINSFVRHSATSEEKTDQPAVAYTEYQELQARDAIEKGFDVREMEVALHPICGEKGVAAFMIIQRLNSMGLVIGSIPDMDSSNIDNAEKITILFSTKLAPEEIVKNASIPGITSEIVIRHFSASEKKATAPDRRAQGIKSQMLTIETLKVDRVMNLVGELIIGRSMIDHIARDVADGAEAGEIASRLFAANSYMERTVSDIQKGVMKMRMVPVNHVFRKFPKIVRDLSIEKQKKVRLDIRGRETELDKGIVDALGEPLAHIVRNFIDHGIESPEHRKSLGKSEEGVITLSAYHEAAQIVIEASDDGRGIDTAALKRKAVERGFINPDEAERLSESDAVNLMFLPGLSTSDVVDEISGRGVGMSVVKSAIEGMRGSVEIESIQDKGTKFRLRLPLTLAVIKALLFEIGERLYAIPVFAVAEVTRVMLDDLVTVDGKDTLILRDKIISVIHLQGLFGIGSRGDGKKFILILDIGGRDVGLVADRLLGQQELVIKAIDSEHARSGSIAGASILGDGRVVLILDAPALIRKAVDNEKKRMVWL